MRGVRSPEALRLSEYAYFFYQSRIRHTMFAFVSWARRSVEKTDRNSDLRGHAGQRHNLAAPEDRGGGDENGHGNSCRLYTSDAADQ